jgi:hypothetical protein
MQPASAAAGDAAGLVAAGTVLLPRGNDGVGIVGAFADAMPGRTPLLVVGPEDSVADIRRRIASLRRVVLAGLAQDDASKAAVPRMQAALEAGGWRVVGRGFDVAVYERTE